MAESTLRRFADQVAQDPATDRLKQELQSYARARAEQAVTNLGHKLGESVQKLGDPGEGGGLPSGLSKGAKALSEGESPAKAAATAGATQLKDTVKDKVKGLFGKGGGGGKSGGGKSKSVTVIEDIDVGVPLREAYDQWTQYQEFSTFAKGVVSVEKADETSSNWKVKVAKSTRGWRANVTEQIPDERIAWTTEGAKGTVKGVVTFHRLADNLTRVLLVLEYFPVGLFEKTGNIWRAQGRRARLDLKQYRRFLMLRGTATDGWRGEIRDGEVVVQHADAVAEEGAEEDDGQLPDEGDQDEPVAEEDEPEAGDTEEADADDPDDESDESDEAEEAAEDPETEDPEEEDPEAELPEDVEEPTDQPRPARR
ncbi:SRPBCC family protein [Streptomyces oceani]|uniref:Cyclase n=1 Tax=Streptomyces oceani TaxID=1075402 RepID=A0A1E7KPD7_9ACTN|nr:SRPBCC family protein [Streptomyces oceani]OEV05777.1 cyclase [Streptomyces oceani]